MARLPRLYIPGLPQLMLQRSVRSLPIWQDDADAALLVDALRQGARANGLAIHAWALLPDRLLLLATPSDERSGARTLQALGRRYVSALNRRHGHTGTLWEGRYRSTVLDPDEYFLAASQFVEGSPVMRGLVRHPGDWKWSSYAHHIGLQVDSLVSDHPVYWALANTPFERQAAYQQLFQDLPAPEVRAQIEQALERGWLLASAQAGRQFEALASRRMFPAQPGRPYKKTVPK